MLVVIVHTLESGLRKRRTWKTSGWFGWRNRGEDCRKQRLTSEEPKKPWDFPRLVLALDRKVKVYLVDPNPKLIEYLSLGCRFGRMLLHNDTPNPVT